MPSHFSDVAGSSHFAGFLAASLLGQVISHVGFSTAVVAGPPILREWADPPDQPVVELAVMNDACPATDLGTLVHAGGSWSGDTSGLANNFEDDYPQPCSYGAGGADEIFHFRVDTTGIWHFNTCGACLDTSIGIREDTGAGCPGDPVACDGDGCNDCYFESYLDTFLAAGKDYFIVIDAYASQADCGNCPLEGPYAVNYDLVRAACTSDAYCDDGRFCNGVETCDLGTGSCLPGTPPCEPVQTCDPSGYCTDPDPRLIYRNTIYVADVCGWGPCPGIEEGELLADDWEFAPGALGRQLIRYDVDVLGTTGTYAVTTSLWPHGLNCVGGSSPGIECDVDADCAGGSTCMDTGFSPAPPGQRRPGHAAIPGTICIFADIAPGYYVTLECAPSEEVALPPEGVWVVLGRTEGVVQPRWAGIPPDIGWSVDAYVSDEGSEGALWNPLVWWADMGNFFGTLSTVPVGACCNPPGTAGATCTIETEADCTAAGGVTIGLNNAVHQFDCSADSDGDGTADPCDACPDNPEFDGGPGPCGCSSANADHDTREDGFTPCYDCEDRCPNNADFCEHFGPCLCSSLDSDGDGTLDCRDGCRFDPLKIAPGVCGCGIDDNADSDGDGVTDCLDLCNGVDDTAFGPECDRVIPTASAWGLVVLTLLLLVSAKVYWRGKNLPRSFAFRSPGDW